MKKLKDKPSLMPAATANKSGKDCYIQRPVIKLREVTTIERQRLRIPSYQYLLP